MAIDSFKSLLTNPTFKTLVKAQAVQDDRDPALKKCSMTRSPFQLLALILLWSITTEESKLHVIKQINNILQLSSFNPITQTDLDNLSKELNWEKLSSELNSSPNHFFKLLLPKTVIDNLQEAKSISENFLSNVVQEGRPAECKVITTIQQNLTWIDSFCETAQTWTVPSRTFDISDGLKRELEKIKENMSPQNASPQAVTVGAFAISARKLTKESSEPVADVYQVLINKGKSTEFTAELKQTEINSGLYTAFIGANLIGKFPVTGIQVLLEGSAFLNQHGIGVTQVQEVGCESYFPGRHVPKKMQTYDYFCFDIEISNTYVLFDSLIAVDFSHPTRKTSTSDNLDFHDIYISLKGKIDYDNINLDSPEERARADSKRRVKLYPHSLTHRNALEIFYNESIGIKYGSHRNLLLTTDTNKKSAPPTDKHKIKFTCSLL